MKKFDLLPLIQIISYFLNFPNVIQLCHSIIRPTRQRILDPILYFFLIKIVTIKNCMIKVLFKALRKELY